MPVECVRFGGDKSPRTMLYISLCLELHYFCRILFFVYLYVSVDEVKAEDRIDQIGDGAVAFFYGLMGKKRKPLLCLGCGKQIFPSLEDSDTQEVCNCKRSIFGLAYLPAEQVALDFTSFTFLYEIMESKQITKNRNGHFLLVLFTLFIIIPPLIIIFFVFNFYYSVLGHFLATLWVNNVEKSKCARCKWIYIILHILDYLSYLFFVLQTSSILAQNEWILFNLILYSVAGLILNTDVVVSVSVVIVIGFCLARFLKIQSDFNVLKAQVFEVVEEYTSGKKNSCPLSRTKMKEKALEQASSRGYPNSSYLYIYLCCENHDIDSIERVRSSECSINLDNQS